MIFEQPKITRYLSPLAVFGRSSEDTRAVSRKSGSILHGITDHFVLKMVI